MNNDNTIKLYNYVIIQRYKTTNRLIQLDYTKNKLSLQDFNIGGLLKLQQVENDIEATRQTLQRYNEALTSIERELFGHNISVIEQAETIINGGNM